MLRQDCERVASQSSFVSMQFLLGRSGQDRPIQSELGMAPARAVQETEFMNVGKKTMAVCAATVERHIPFLFNVSDDDVDRSPLFDNLR